MTTSRAAQCFSSMTLLTSGTNYQHQLPDFFLLYILYEQNIWLDAVYLSNLLVLTVFRQKALVALTNLLCSLHKRKISFILYMHQNSGRKPLTHNIDVKTDLVIYRQKKKKRQHFLFQTKKNLAGKSTFFEILAIFNSLYFNL